MELIERIYGERRYTTQVTANEMARRVWTNMPFSLQEKWKDRAHTIKSKYVPGQFLALPPSVPVSVDTFLCDCFREETKYLQKCFKNALTRPGQRHLYKKHIKIPHKYQIGTLAWRAITLSPAVQKLLTMNTVFPYENVGTNEPKIFHFATHGRVNSVLFFDDVVFSQYRKRKTRTIYNFTSVCILQRPHGATLKSYGWSETESMVTFIYQTGRYTTGLVTFRRPIFVTSVVIRNKKNIKRGATSGKQAT